MPAIIHHQGTVSKVAAGVNFKNLISLLGIGEKDTIYLKGKDGKNITIDRKSSFELKNGMELEIIPTDKKDHTPQPQVEESTKPVVRILQYKSKVETLNKTPKVFKKLPPKKTLRYVKRVIDLHQNGETEIVYEQKQAE